MIKLIVARKQQDTLARRFAAWRVEDCLELPGSEQALLPAEASTHHKTGKSDCETSTALGATTRQDGTAVLGSHASTEAVGTSAFDGAGLESAFHDAVTWLSTTDRNGPRFKRPAILEKAAGQVNFQPVVLQIEKYKGKNLFRKACYVSYKCMLPFLWISSWRAMPMMLSARQKPVRKRCCACSLAGHRLGIDWLVTHRADIPWFFPWLLHAAQGELSTDFKRALSDVWQIA